MIPADFTDVLERARKRFTELGNPELVAKYARYFREGYDAYGLTEKQLHEFMEEELAAHPDWSVRDIVDLGLVLFAEGKYEMGSLGLLWLEKRKKQWDRDTLPAVKSWYDRGVSNWAHSDVICSRILSPLIGNGLATLGDLAEWRSAESRWTRRAVPVAMLVLRKTVDPGILLDFLEPMMGDGERVVHQGLGWFLRDLWKIHPLPVEALLMRYKDTSARLIFQYATEKMTKEQKERFRRAKKTIT
jgi:3-methyladenine DNA glycosylase AlkD